MISVVIRCDSVIVKVLGTTSVVVLGTPLIIVEVVGFSEMTVWMCCLVTKSVW